MYVLADDGLLRWVSGRLLLREPPRSRSPRRARGRPRGGAMRGAAARRRAPTARAPDPPRMSPPEHLQVVPVEAELIFWRGRPTGLVFPDGTWFRWVARSGSWGAARTREAALVRLLDTLRVSVPHTSPRVDELCRAEGHIPERNPNYNGIGRGIGRRCTRCGQTWVEYPDGAIT